MNKIHKDIEKSKESIKNTKINPKAKHTEAMIIYALFLVKIISIKTLTVINNEININR